MSSPAYILHTDPLDEEKGNKKKRIETQTDLPLLPDGSIDFAQLPLHPEKVWANPDVDDDFSKSRLCAMLQAAGQPVPTSRFPQGWQQFEVVDSWSADGTVIHNPIEITITHKTIPFEEIKVDGEGRYQPPERSEDQKEETVTSGTSVGSGLLSSTPSSFEEESVPFTSSR